MLLLNSYMKNSIKPAKPFLQGEIQVRENEGISFTRIIEYPRRAIGVLIESGTNLLRKYEHFQRAETDMAVARNLNSFPDLSAKCYEDGARHYLSSRFIYPAIEAFFQAARKYNDAVLNPPEDHRFAGNLRGDYLRLDSYLSATDPKGWEKIKHESLMKKMNKFSLRRDRAKSRSERIERLLGIGERK